MKLTMATAGCSGSSSANRWHTFSDTLPCFFATKPNTLKEGGEEAGSKRREGRPGVGERRTPEWCQQPPRPLSMDTSICWNGRAPGPGERMTRCWILLKLRRRRARICEAEEGGAKRKACWLPGSCLWVQTHAWPLRRKGHRTRAQCTQRHTQDKPASTYLDVVLSELVHLKHEKTKTSSEPRTHTRKGTPTSRCSPWWRYADPLKSHYQTTMLAQHHPIRVHIAPTDMTPSNQCLHYTHWHNHPIKVHVIPSDITPSNQAPKNKESYKAIQSGLMPASAWSAISCKQSIKAMS